jgi:hypothetical protein
MLRDRLRYLYGGQVIILEESSFMEHFRIPTRCFCDFLAVSFLVRRFMICNAEIWFLRAKILKKLL